MDKLQVFENADFGKVRMIMVNDEPYFVGKDVAEVLGYQNGSRDISRHVDEDDRQKFMIFDGNQNKETIVINESGLYSLILSSKLPNAKKFKKWVTSEVLPSIRKHGAYMTDDTMEKVLLNPDFGIKLLTELKTEREKSKSLEIANKQQEQLIGELKPKADYTDTILQSKALVNINQIAKDYGMSARTMNKLLSDRGVQYKQGKQWLLYRKYHNKGYTSSETVNITHSDGRPDVIMRTKWTQKGRLFIYELLKGDGIIPIIEKAFN